MNICRGAVQLLAAASHSQRALINPRQSSPQASESRTRNPPLGFRLCRIEPVPYDGCPLSFSPF
jgi:hypothetical protein